MLFRNELGEKFEPVSVRDKALAAVARADWSWGGQFVDLDNDRFLDLYVPNGYFTAPVEYASKDDF